MTVCIAARAGNTLVLASDRLLTAGDIQFEPLRQKIVAITRSITILTAGDASFLTLILPQVFAAAHEDLGPNPDHWLTVKKVVEFYVKFFIEERSKMAERAILAPLGLDRASFLNHQKTMDPDLVRRLASGLLDYQAPDCAVIIAGCDPEGSHIYVVDGTNVSAYDDVGFAAIGMGARHANSQFMLARHAWHGSLSDTLLLTYLAKRRSEAAPGVGSETDMMIIGPGLGESQVVAEEATNRLRQEYEKIVANENLMMASAKNQISTFVQEQLTRAPAQVTNQAEPRAIDATPDK